MYINELTLGSTDFIGDRSLGTLWEELDGGETPDVVFRGDGLVVGLIGVHVRNNTVGLGSECSGDVLISRLHVLVVSLPPSAQGQRSIPCSDHTIKSAWTNLRVTATYPWSSESNENILILVQNDIVKVACGNLDSGRRSRGLDLGFRSRFLSNASISSFSARLRITHNLAKESRSRPPW